MPDVYLMHKILAVATACLLAGACSGARPTDPTKVPELSRTRFLAFGDSMTAGEVTVPVGLQPDPPVADAHRPRSLPMILVPSASYPTQLLSLLQSRFARQASTVAVTNAGKPGEYSFDAKVRFGEVLAAERPEVVLLLHGANDLAFGNSDLPAGALFDMVRQGKAAGVQVFLSTLMVAKPGGRNSPNPVVVDEVNAKIKAMAAAEGVVLVNLYDALQPEAATLIGVDGLHPTEAGYKRIADVFFAAIQANLEVK